VYKRQDQFSGYTFSKLVTFRPEEFAYSRPAEINEDSMANDFSPETNHFLAANNLYATKSFEELEEKITEANVEMQKEIFDATPFQEENIAVDGTIISKCGINKRFNDPYSFGARLVEKSSGRYGVLLGIDVGEGCLELDSVETRFSGAHTGVYNTSKASNLNGVLTVDLTPDASFAVPADGVEMITDIKFKNGLNVRIPLGTVDMAEGFYGLGEPNGILDGKDVFIPSDFGVTQLGIADYRKVVQTLC